MFLIQVLAAPENRTIEEHIESLWPVLTRQPDVPKGSLIPLPHSYIVPGGRFGEIYYWDSYFTMLGLQASGRTDMIENMVNNFSHLIDTCRLYTQWQPHLLYWPFTASFLFFDGKTAVRKKGEKILAEYLPQWKRNIISG